jgi:diaminohydroxyphosphoribosylaminopyrimidine deaminase / 5-amino-6-(5-phosphoribosylamino)uracil reductase
VVVAAVDPNPLHAGKAFELLRHTGIDVEVGVLSDKATHLNEAFNHWIIHRRPFVTVKVAMSMDGKIATRSGESKWITSEASRQHAIERRYRADAILVGINTILRDDPGLTARGEKAVKALRRIILDSDARTPLTSRILNDEHAHLTTIVAGDKAPARKLAVLERKVQVWCAPERNEQINLDWLLKKLGAENVTNLLVEGGGEVNASFLLGGLAHAIAFFYAPLIVGGNDAKKAVSGIGILDAAKGVRLIDVKWQRIGVDLLLTARMEAPRK